MFRLSPVVVSIAVVDVDVTVDDPEDIDVVLYVVFTELEIAGV